MIMKKRFNTAGPCKADIHYMLPAGDCLPELKPLNLKNESLVINRSGDRKFFRLAEVSLLVIHAGVQLTSVVIAELMDRGIETIFLKQDGQFRGRLQGSFHTNPMLRLAQYQVVDSTFGMAIAQKLIEGKIRNQRVILQRRNRQPPLDLINALLSWGYGVLLARVFAAAVLAGLDPYFGFFHVTQPYRPNLALDLMEEFRPVVVDAAVIAIIQANLLDPTDLEPSPDGAGIWLGVIAKKLFLRQLEQQFSTPFIYPSQNRKLRLSQILVEQAMAFGRCLLERSLDYQPYVIK